MRTLIYYLFEHVDFFLLLVVIILLGFLFSLFFKKKRTVIVAIIISVVIGFLIYDQLKYTTFEKLVSAKLHEETVVRDISITIYDLSSDEGFPERKATVTIDDVDLMNRILEDFSGIELKKNLNAQGEYMKEFEVKILTTNLKDDQYYLTNYLMLSLGEQFLNEYEIVSETNHLKTIKELVNNEEIEWQFYDY